MRRFVSIHKAFQAYSEPYPQVIRVLAAAAVSNLSSNIGCVSWHSNGEQSPQYCHIKRTACLRRRRLQPLRRGITSPSSSKIELCLGETGLPAQDRSARVTIGECKKITFIEPLQSGGRGLKPPGTIDILNPVRIGGAPTVTSSTGSGFRRRGMGKRRMGKDRCSSEAL